MDEVLPAPRLFILGLQHLFIMYAGAVAVPLIVGGALGLPVSTIGLLVNADLFVSGIATVIQSVGIGKILGCGCRSWPAPRSPCSARYIIAQKYGLAAVYGALLCSGVFGLLIAKPFSMMVRFFPPLVAGTVICVIGLSLIGADVSLIAGDNPAAKDYGQVSHIALAGLVVLLIVVITRTFRGFISQIAVLISIAIGTLVAWPMGLLDFSSASSAAWVGFSGFFRFGHPKFEAAAIISMCIVMLVTYTESTADMLAVSEMVDKKLTQNDLARGLATDALSAVLAGFLNSFPDTAFAENVGLVGLTRVRSRWVVTTCGTLLILLGLLPKFGQIVASIPGPVIGGAATVMFAMVTAVGIQTLNKAFRRQPQPADRRGVPGGGPAPGRGADLLRALPQRLPGHLRVQHHLHGDRGVHPEHRVQPLDLAAQGRVRGGGRGARGRSRGGRPRRRRQAGPRRRGGT